MKAHWYKGISGMKNKTLSRSGTPPTGREPLPHGRYEADIAASPAAHNSKYRTTWNFLIRAAWHASMLTGL